MSNREISLMVAPYDRTQAFFSGEVSLEGIDLKVFPPPSQGAACYRPVYEMFDVVEMSLSWYLMARSRGAFDCVADFSAPDVYPALRLLQRKLHG